MKIENRLLCLQESIGKSSLQKTKTYDLMLKYIPSLADFNPVVDWQNSSFYKQTLKNEIKAWYISQYIWPLFKLGTEYRYSSIAI